MYNLTMNYKKKMSVGNENKNIHAYIKKKKYVVECTAYQEHTK